MLRIEKVFIQGFKSFCDPTEVVFDAEGITAVVGPNGCGKSNVADALSWVIGEQRAKALRGGKMEDVIFQGSRNRQPSGLAEVMLTLKVFTSFEIRFSDKPDVTAPQAQENALTPPTPTKPSSARTYQEGETITIARRLYRTGESEYEMNGRTCRLRDIQDLFAGTGLGAAHYAIIEQGRIGQVLSAKPLDRRSLIEEAAGISKFKMRQRAAELKLEAARQNLSRITDIIAEVERQEATLKRQAAKARRFQRLRTEMRELMKIVLVSEYSQTQQGIQELAEQREIITQQETEIARRISETEAVRQATIALTNQSDLNLTTARTLAAESNLQIEKARQQQNYLQTQITTLTQRSQQYSQDQLAISERRQLLLQEGERLREELRVIENAINIEASHLSQAEKVHAEQSSQDYLIEKQLEMAQRQVTEAATHRERWSQLARQFADAVDRCQKTITGLATEQQRATEQAQKINQEQGAALEILSQTEQEHGRIRDDLFQIKQQLSLKQVAVRDSENKLNHLQKQSLTVEQRHKSLLELDERRAYFSETVQAIIQESKKHSEVNFNIIGTLADFIKVLPKDEVIVEAGLREELQYLLTPTFDDALRAIDFLKREQQGRATFLVLNSIPKNTASPGEGSTGSQIVRLIDLLGLKPDLRQIIQQALPLLSQTVVTDQLQQAIQASISTNGKGNSFLTATGEFVSAGHIISGGSLSEQGRGILALKREIEELQEQLLMLTQQMSQAEETTTFLRREVAQITEQGQALEIQQHEIEKALVQQRAQLAQQERDQERTATHLRVIEAELDQIQIERTAAIEKLQQAETALQKAETAFIEAEALATSTGEAILQIRQAATERVHGLSSRRADFAAKAERRKGLHNDIRRLENEGEDINNRLSRIQMEVVATEEQVRSLRVSQTNLDDELKTVAEIYQTQLGAVETLGAKLIEEKEKLTFLEATLAEARNELTARRENRTEIDILRTKSVAKLEHLAAACSSELGEKIEDITLQYNQPTDPNLVTSSSTKMAQAQADDEESEEAELNEPIHFSQPSADFDLESARKHLEILRGKVESIGPVNLLALQELGEQENRLAFLLEQKADIELAVTDTLSVITELKRRSRERFIEAFHQINRNFGEMFLELFGGGHGEMRLIDESDVLESGIDIIAQPPGKRLQNVLLLSGGEKAMAALALVMGIFKYRPSPFCLLDEVDAPLDDVNIGRFADKVLEMSQHTQFVVITHSKRTMEAAKTLYGVTMEDPGVSKLISVRLT